MTGPAQKEFRKLPGKDQARVRSALAAMQADPFSGDVVRLKAQPVAWRLVGNYRILYDLDLDQYLIIVASIRRRTSTTY